MNFCLLVVSPAGSVALNGAHAALHRATCLVDRLRPGATHLHDFGAVHEAVPGEHAELRIGVAPARKRRSPFANALQRKDAMATGDRGAIDDASHDRRQLARGGGHHGLIQQRKTTIDLTLDQQRAPLQIAPERNQVGFCKALADLHCASGTFLGFGRLARTQMSLPGRQQEIALLDTILRVKLDQALRPAEPATGPGRLAPREQSKAQPERGTCRQRGSRPYRDAPDTRAPALPTSLHRVPSAPPTRRADAGPRRPAASTGLRVTAPRRRHSTHGGRSKRVRAGAHPMGHSSLARDRSDWCCG